MDFITAEEKLISAQLLVSKELRREEMLSKVDAISVKLQSHIPERIPVTLRTVEQLSSGDKIPIPFPIKGRMLGVGKHKRRYYSAEELKKAVAIWNGKKFSIKLDHRKDEAGATIGAVDRLYWDSDERAIMYEGHINDETYARNVLDEVTTDVSATIEAEERFDFTHGIVGVNLSFPELSLVEKGAYMGNTISPAI